MSLKSFSLSLVLASAAMVAGGAAQAQYVGPSSLQVRTVQQLLDDGRDDDRAQLRGRIVSHDGGERYTFADDSGRIAVEIDARVFPAGVKIGERDVVVLTGELERGFRKLKFEVETIELAKP